MPVQQEPYKKQLLMKNEKFLEKSQENGPSAEKLEDRKSKRARQKNKRGDRKGESNYSPGIPVRVEHQTATASLQGKMQREALFTHRRVYHQCGSSRVCSGL